MPSIKTTQLENNRLRTTLSTWQCIIMTMIVMLSYSRPVKAARSATWDEDQAYLDTMLRTLQQAAYDPDSFCTAFNGNNQIQWDGIISESDYLRTHRTCSLFKKQQTAKRMRKICGTPPSTNLTQQLMPLIELADADATLTKNHTTYLLRKRIAQQIAKTAVDYPWMKAALKTKPHFIMKSHALPETPEAEQIKERDRYTGEYRADLHALLFYIENLNRYHLKYVLWQLHQTATTTGLVMAAEEKAVDTNGAFIEEKTDGQAQLRTPYHDDASQSEIRDAITAYENRIQKYMQALININQLANQDEELRQKLKQLSGHAQQRQQQKIRKNQKALTTQQNTLASLTKACKDDQYELEEYTIILSAAFVQKACRRTTMETFQQRLRNGQYNDALNVFAGDQVFNIKATTFTPLRDGSLAVTGPCDGPPGFTFLMDRLHFLTQLGDRLTNAERTQKSSHDDNRRTWFTEVDADIHGACGPNLIHLLAPELEQYHQKREWALCRLRQDTPSAHSNKQQQTMQRR